MSYYDVLGIPQDADEETIRSAFRNLARRYHPDAGEGSSSERFRQLVEAYEILSDPAERRLYDLSLRPVRQRAVPVEPMVAGPEPMRSTQARTTIFSPYARRPDWDGLFDEVFHSIDDFFGPTLFRW